MKFLIVCLFAAAYAAPEAEAEAEADPALLYGGYGYPYAYGGYGLTHGLGHLGYAGLPVAHTVVKTVAADAEEPAVDEVKTVAAPVAYAHAAYPYATYANHVGYPYAHAAYNYAPYAGYAAYAAPVATHVVAKRSAEAKPEADAYYGHYGYTGYPRAYGYSGYRAYGYGSPRAYGHYGYAYG